MNPKLKRTAARFLTVAFIALSANFAYGEALIIVNEVGGNQTTATGGSADPSALRSEADWSEATLGPAAMTFDLTIDTLSDILVIDAEISVAAGEIFPESIEPSKPGRPPTAEIDWGHTAEPQIEVFCHRIPIGCVRWWMTTPGNTSAADPSELLAGERISHFDTTNEGAQTGFKFAHFTLIPDAQGNAEATLNAWIQTAAQPTPVIDFVSVTMSIVPEPDTGLFAIASLFAFVVRRQTRSNRIQR